MAKLKVGDRVKGRGRKFTFDPIKEGIIKRIDDGHYVVEVLIGNREDQKGYWEVNAWNYIEDELELIESVNPIKELLKGM